MSVYNLLSLRTTNVSRPNKRYFFTLNKQETGYTAETMINADYTDELALLLHTPTQAESLLYSREQAVSMWM